MEKTGSFGIAGGIGVLARAFVYSGSSLGSGRYSV